MNTIQTPTLEEIEEMTSARIKEELVKIHKRLGGPDMYFILDPTSASQISFEKLCKDMLLFFIDFEKFKNGEPQMLFKKADENDFN